MQCPVFVLATDEGHSVTETFGKSKNPISASVRRRSYSMSSPPTKSFLTHCDDTEPNKVSLDGITGNMHIGTNNSYICQNLMYTYTTEQVHYGLRQ